MDGVKSDAMYDPRQPVFLVECADPSQLGLVKGLLQSERIPFVVQSELHAALVAGPLGNAAVLARVLVAEGDVDRARALLEARPVDPLPGDPPRARSTRVRVVAALLVLALGLVPLALGAVALW